ncbi:MAG TPA: type II toxin-antitoxin system RelE/ParE family toxin [Terriglobales bacterium]|jgi:toxin ParE1/3/4|nr:type II toxin-antitoxin system RelE/ParE family toxin [Terriglobales bacterium]
MAYVVNTTPHAERDLARLYRQINAEYSDTAMEWYLGIREAILSLERQPNRCPLTRRKGKLRHLLYGRKPYVYRVIYRVQEKRKQVEVLHIRHGARREFKPSDLM